MNLLIRNARILTLAAPGSTGNTPVRPRRGAALRELGVIPRGDVWVRDGKIAAVGSAPDAPADCEVIDADGRVLMPGFVDCHTHACWAGDRLDEWTRQLAGTPAKEIARLGGGLHATVRAVRELTRKQLAAGLRTRLDLMLRGGTTTMEVKSGYGLSAEAELKMLHAINRAADGWAGTVVPTALLGGALDGEPAAYTRLVVREILPAVWHEFPGIAIDARCDEGAWPLEACVRLFERAGKHGLPLRVQADRHTSTGMIAEALRFHARSIDDLSAATPADLKAIAASDTFAVLLPAANFHENRPMPRTEILLKENALIALASNYNPGTAPTHSMPFIIALAVRYGGLTAAEAIVASTVNPAAVLGLSDRGTIEPGRRADLVLLKHRDERALAHEFGGNPVETVIVVGQRIAG
jgi:imidazolonepropionase